jgi:hypothetical protein
MSALGHKQTYALQKAMSALPTSATRHVCFTPKSGHVQCKMTCPLWAKSGHAEVRGSHSSGVITGLFQIGDELCE